MLSLAKKQTNQELNSNKKMFWFKIILGQFIKYRLVSAVDNQPLNLPQKSSFSQLETLKILTKVFFTLGFFSGLVLLALTLAYPQVVLPQKNDFFFSRVLSLNIFSSLLLGAILALGHEFAHALTGLAMGLKRVGFSLGHRWYYLTLETKLNDIYMIKEKKRYPIYLAGVVFDIIVLAFLALVKVSQHLALVSLSVSHLRFLNHLFLIQWLGLVWEAMFFLKSDLYYLLIDFFDIEDFKLGLFLKKVNLRSFKKMVFALLFVFGQAWVAYRFFSLFLPIKLNTLWQAVSLTTLANPAQKLDGLLTILIEVCLSLFLLKTIRKKGFSLITTLKLKT